MQNYKDNFIASDENSVFKFAVISVIGGREEQQDSVGYEIKSDEGLIAVCDGMGGHQGGKIASSVAVEMLLKKYSEEYPVCSAYDSLVDTVEEIDRYIAGLTDFQKAFAVCLRKKYFIQLISKIVFCNPFPKNYFVSLLHPKKCVDFFGESTLRLRLLKEFFCLYPWKNFFYAHIFQKSNSRRQPLSCCASGELEFREAEVGKVAVHIFNFNKVFKATDQIAHTHTAFFHKFVLTVKTAVIVIATYGIAVIENSRVDVSCGTSETCTGFTDVFGGKIFVFSVISATHTQIEIYALGIGKRAVEAKFHHVAVVPKGNRKVFVIVTAVSVRGLLIYALVAV